MQLGKLYTFWLSIDGMKDKEIQHQNFFDGYQKITDYLQSKIKEEFKDRIVIRFIEE